MAILDRFSHADSLSVLMQNTAGEWVDEYTQTRTEGGIVAVPSKTLLKRAIKGLEVVSYLPGAELGPESVAGLAGALLVPRAHALVFAGALFGAATCRSCKRAFQRCGHAFPCCGHTLARRAHTFRCHEQTFWCCRIHSGDFGRSGFLV